ncbi:hypothetical protein ACWD00_25625 [Streptomyces viridiviolaceus]
MTTTSDRTRVSRPRSRDPLNPTASGRLGIVQLLFTMLALKAPLAIVAGFAALIAG